MKTIDVKLSDYGKIVITQWVPKDITPEQEEAIREHTRKHVASMMERMMARLDYEAFIPLSDLPPYARGGFIKGDRPGLRPFTTEPYITQPNKVATFNGKVYVNGTEIKQVKQFSIDPQGNVKLEFKADTAAAPPPQNLMERMG